MRRVSERSCVNRTSVQQTQGDSARSGTIGTVDRENLSIGLLQVHGMHQTSIENWFYIAVFHSDTEQAHYFLFSSAVTSAV
jgi:hypothetical protein